MDDRLLTVAEVAAQLKLNQQTVRNWIDRGELPAVRVGSRRVRIRERDLDALLAAGETTPKAPEAELRVRLRSAVSGVCAALDAHQDPELLSSLEELARVSGEMVRLLRRQQAIRYRAGEL